MITEIIELTVMADVHISCVWANENEMLGSWDVMEMFQ